MSPSGDRPDYLRPVPAGGAVPGTMVPPPAGAVAPQLDPVPDGCEVLTAPGGGMVWWRLVLSGGTAVGAVFVGPPGSSKELTKLLQTGADLTAHLPSMRAGELALATA